ncbi:MAG: hypothetical protein HOP04_14125 [Methylophilaceae bacterium]|nr:hypothetical protein [Methylophilaceae bacterium]
MKSTISFKKSAAISALTLASLACASFHASAADRPETAQVASADFAKLDANHDEKLSREEVATDKGLSTSFDGLDTNFDGVLDAKEYNVAKSAEVKK